MTDDKDDRDDEAESSGNPATGRQIRTDDNPLFPPAGVAVSADELDSAIPSWRDPAPETLAALPEWESLPKRLREGILLTYGLWLSQRVGLALASPQEAVRKMGLEWSEVLRLMPLFEQKLREEARGPGRPKKVVEDKMAHPGTKQVMYAVRDYLMHNPGCAGVGKTGQRHEYSDAFKAFVLELLGQNGPGHGMTPAQAEYATGVSIHTLTAWRQGSCRAALSKPK